MRKSVGQQAGELAVLKAQAELEKRKAGIPKAALRLAQALDAKKTDEADHKIRTDTSKFIFEKIYGAVQVEKTDVKHSFDENLTQLVVHELAKQKRADSANG